MWTENAAEVAVQLADITNNALSDEEVTYLNDTLHAVSTLIAFSTVQ